ncbi:hypothetical protein [Granulosicoccus antarcticus]|uniref:DUF2214 domain-containing protein n=1 Tax=Granulosicoccus antarcticus IMCC3135 TaxID=1192854 RepID=A0A2Z2NN19_9GAMM|nr:hypothetical protein [Granulosicoccus antarcticus]ASJ72619.1 hypothetical protein IMCC3135_12655 [Granulosicoccus antarcticus IMCC3135]
METIIELLSNSALNQFITSHSWVWPTLEMFHFLGLCLLLGSLLIVDLSVIGFAPNISLRLVDKFIIATLIGFAINLITGALFVVGDPGRYFINIAFRIKILFIIIAGLNALYFTFKVRPKIQAGANNFSDLSLNAKLSTGLSLCLWTSIIVLGRFIPYVEDL